MITVERTGRTFSDSSVEFAVTYPDGSHETLWSPVWSAMEYDDPAQDEGAMREATKRWQTACI